MEDKVTAKKPRMFRPDRIGLNEVSLKRLNSWLVAVQTNLKGMTLTKGELVNWLISAHSEELTPTELSDLQVRYFDQKKFAEWALDEYKAAQARGESTTFFEIVSKNQPKIKKERPASKVSTKRTKPKN